MTMQRGSSPNLWTLADVGGGGRNPKSLPQPTPMESRFSGLQFHHARFVYKNCDVK